MLGAMKDHLSQQLSTIAESGLYKTERIITSPQQARIEVTSGERVLNMCANNYLGLANHPEIIAAARASLDQWGYGLSSVRFICGTQEIHRQLEAQISALLGTEDTLLYSSCFDANGGLFETLLTDEDESTKTPGVFLVGPTVVQGELSFCFVYKFRQRFGIVADAIAKGLGRETAAAVDAARDMNMYLDDFECCKAACGEAC